MKLRVVVLGAGFGGMELSSILSETLGDDLDLTLIDQNDSFYFGFSKLDVMFGRKSSDAVKIPYSSISKPGVQFRKETITSIQPATRTVTTQNTVYEADVLVVALGADYDIQATPGLVEFGNEYYTFEGAEKLREVIPSFRKGHAIVGVCGAPFKCPPAPSEAALMLHDYLSTAGIRDACTISLVIPYGSPIPPSPDSSKALIKAFEERNIQFIPQRKVTSIDGSRKLAVLDDGTEMPFDLFLGIPKHVAPDVVLQSGMVENGWIPVDRAHLLTKFPNVYAIGDVTSVGTPKAGVFAEGAAKTAAASIIAAFNKKENQSPYTGAGSCYIEFGKGEIGRVDVDFFSGPKPFGIHHDASAALAADKEYFGSSRKARWFGINTA
ncbi:FAD/NAD(P)-binding oxidoreductase [Flavitalea sp. BT771]|uniref:NAD(P)/FAD-dependent oxidoreductase n=1 Tax=Flavitalea sp. BT771 TaxID=3063329 RepID=UPI0026E2A091|nr:FAD/NAD(P)-binding oxidoreductase [Flavitalea sp. BT771]MDO6435627.1 FAD/NAD(P)-binding oxidoreductase [Flavitalea sp. BT771]MDV6224527.1 FAD/NAD(P)-binding oxidoreductase [Flavitalea sp. BT771]